MDKYVDILRLSENDVPSIMEIAEECGLSGWSQNDYLAEVARTDSINFGAYCDNVLIGFAIGRVIAGTEDHSEDAEIYNIGTNGLFRKRGIGRQLMKSFYATASLRCVKTVWLEVRAGNTSAIGFYERCGFTSYGIRKRFYTSPPDDAVLMSARVADPL